MNDATGPKSCPTRYCSDFATTISSRIVFAHRDRLARFRFEFIQWLAEQNGGRIVVLDNADYSPEQELTQNILAILHTFSCRLHSLRRYRNAIKEDQSLSDGDAAEDPLIRHPGTVGLTESHRSW